MMSNYQRVIALTADTEGLRPVAKAAYQAGHNAAIGEAAQIAAESDKRIAELEELCRKLATLAEAVVAWDKAGVNFGLSNEGRELVCNLATEARHATSGEGE